MPKAKKSAPKPKTGQSSGFREFLTWLYRPGVLFVMATVCVAPIAVGIAHRLLPSASELEAYQFSTAKIDIGETPTWIPESFLSDVINKADLPETVSVLEEKLTERIHHSFSQHPWVKNVKQVRIESPPSIQVELEFRRPVAMVSTKSGYYPVDRDGILLPPGDFTIDQVSQYPLLTGVQSLPQGPAGENWGDVVLLGGARLADLLFPKHHESSDWKRFGFHTIQLPRRNKAKVELDQLEYRLATEAGNVVVWGIPPGVDSPKEPNATNKLRRMEKYYRDFGGFDSPTATYEIDIRPWSEIKRRMIASENSDRRG